MSDTTKRAVSGQCEEYYVSIFKAELEPIWRNTPFAREIPDMCHARAVLTCTRSNHESTRASRRLLYEYMSDFKRTNPKSPINLMYGQLPTSAGAMRKYLRAVCQLYTKKGPERSFGTAGDQNDVWRPIYTRARVTKRLQGVHRILRATNVAAVRPQIINGVPGLTVYRRDQFRVIRSETDPTEAAEIWYPIKRNGAFCLVRMTANEIEYLDPRNPGKHLFPADENTWGEIQFAFFRLEDSEDSFYGPVDHDMLETRLETNSLRFRSNLGVIYEFPVAIGKNLGEPDENGEFDIGPGSIIIPEGDGGGPEGGDADPFLEFTSPNSRFAEIDGLRSDRGASELRDRQLPPSSIDQVTEVPSGIARVAERADLVDMRGEDAEAFREGERTLKRLFGKAINEAPILIDDEIIELVPVDSLVNLSFPKEEILQKPDEAFAFDGALVDKYIVSYIDLYRKWAPDAGGMADEEIADRLAKNAELYRTLAPPPPADQPSPGITQ